MFAYDGTNFPRLLNPALRGRVIGAKVPHARQPCQLADELGQPGDQHFRHVEARHGRAGEHATLEVLTPRAYVELQGPGTALLVMQKPVRLRNGARMQ
jgi:hypothetical protein